MGGCLNGAPSKTFLLRHGCVNFGEGGGQRSDPTLSTADPESSRSPAPSGLDHVTSHSAHSPNSNEEHHHHHHHQDLHGGHDENGVVGDDVSSDTHGDVIAMPEYVNIFLQDNFRLDRYLIDGQTEGHSETQIDTNNNNNNQPTPDGNSIANGSSGISGEEDDSSLSHQQQQHQQLPPETVVVNVTEEITRPKPPKRTKSQKEVSVYLGSHIWSLVSYLALARR
ncbi:hypothetical protein ElyMa_002502100 [Elysia marginata]|uniref:Uncharacterized protein n=1 Tax=Elysia marginata TaxID=1093978 RepID=A0AAV4GTD1_9GAST|nr:hypothetical protein ElyMa_002502100 [Elysia marginata]